MIGSVSLIQVALDRISRQDCLRIVSEVNHYVDYVFSRSNVFTHCKKYGRSVQVPTIQPTGNQFDLSVHILMDTIVIALIQDQKNMNNYMKNQLANLDQKGRRICPMLLYKLRNLKRW